MSLNEIKTEVQQKISARDFLNLRTALNTYGIQELAQLLNELSAPEDIIVFRLLSFTLATETFEFMSADRQEALIKALAKRESRLASLLNDLSPDERTALFEELPGPVTQRLLRILEPDERKVSTMLLGYPEDSIGRLMTTEFVTIKPEYTVAQALEHSYWA
jgi:magnesium transporter